MIKVGDETEGYCPRCKLNTYQIVSATDGREVFSVTCRTCRNTFAWQKERGAEELRQKAIAKLKKMHRPSRPMLPPSVATLGRSRGGDMDMALRANEALLGRKIDIGGGRPMEPDAMRAAATAQQATALATAAASGGEEAPNSRWQRLTATLSARDGRPYNQARVYKPGDVLLHKGFGLGIVREVVHEQACMVLFRDQETVLPMAMPANLG